MNTTKAFNEQQRKEVNLLRKELTSSKNECLRYEKNIKKTREEAENSLPNSLVLKIESIRMLRI